MHNYVRMMSLSDLVFAVSSCMVIFNCFMLLLSAVIVCIKAHVLYSN